MSTKTMSTKTIEVVTYRVVLVGLGYNEINVTGV